MLTDAELTRAIEAAEAIVGMLHPDCRAASRAKDTLSNLHHELEARRRRGSQRRHADEFMDDEAA